MNKRQWFFIVWLCLLTSALVYTIIASSKEANKERQQPRFCTSFVKSNKGIVCVYDSTGIVAWFYDTTNIIK